jgi:hypothetical protein
MREGTSRTESPENTGKSWRQGVELRQEIQRLREERRLFLELAWAAALLLRDLDEDTFETYEAAELVQSLLGKLTPRLEGEAPPWWSGGQT